MLPTRSAGTPYSSRPDDSESTTEVGNDVVIHRRQPNGSWNWAVDIFNSDAPST